MVVPVKTQFLHMQLRGSAFLVFLQNQLFFEQRVFVMGKISRVYVFFFFYTLKSLYMFGLQRLPLANC